MLIHLIVTRPVSTAQERRSQDADRRKVACDILPFKQWWIPETDEYCFHRTMDLLQQDNATAASEDLRIDQLGRDCAHLGVEAKFCFEGT